MQKKTLTLLAALLFAIPAAPAFAGPADVALLQAYAGNWRGAGELTGPDSGSVRCRLTFEPNGQKLSFNGRCTLAGSGTRTFTGTIAYNDAARRYEATSPEGIAVGRKSGSAITFNMNDTTPQGDITSTMSLRGDEIRVDFELKNNKTGEVAGSRVTFTRS